MKLAHLEAVPLNFYSTVNKLMTDLTQYIFLFYLIGERSGFVKNTLNKLN